MKTQPVDHAKLSKSLESSMPVISMCDKHEEGHGDESLSAPKASQLSQGAKDWIFQLRDGRSVRLPPDFVGNPTFRSVSPLPSFQVDEEIILPLVSQYLLRREMAQCEPPQRYRAWSQNHEMRK